MQGFSGKILPAGLEIFSENRRLDLAFPSNPGITFAPRTEMTAWCGSLKGAKMEVNENRGRLGRINFRRKSVKRGNHQKKKMTSPEAWNGQTPSKEVCLFPIRRNLFSRVATSILPGLSGCVRPPVSFMGQADALGNLSASGKRNNEKRKIIWNPVKAPLGIGAKRKRHSIISLNIV